MESARRAEIEIIYEGKNITTPINEYIKSFAYDDIASGESDRIKISLHDISKKWMDEWMPSKCDRLSVKLVLKNWNSGNTVDELYCGEFELDDMSFSGRPLTCELGAVSIPRNEPFNSQLRTKTWESITIQEIAKEITERAGVGLHYEAEDIPIEIIEQSGQTDCKFLYSLCADYGLAMKVYANKIILFDEENYENRPSVRTINETDVTKWSYNSTVAGTYTGANIRFSDPNNEEEYMVSIGGGSRILEINESTDNIKDAERKGIAKLNKENKKAVTMSITVKTDIRVLAGTCVNLNGFSGKIDGRYYVDKASISKSGNSVCTEKLVLHRIVPRIKTVSIGVMKQAGEENSNVGSSYTVVSGDTLWRIAKQFYGRGISYERIYTANKELIEQTAKERGKENSSNGHWIFPGTTLIIPSRGE